MKHLLPETWVSYLTAIKGGFILIPAPTNLIERDIQYRLEQSFPSSILVDSVGAEKIDAIERTTAERIEVKITVGSDRPGWINFDKAKEYNKNALPERTKSDDRLLIFFTSGTTSQPKMVVHTHSTYPLGHLTTAAWLGIRSGDLHYNISQPGWAKFAWSSFFAPWNMGATVFTYYYRTHFSAVKHLETIERYGVTNLCAPPTVWRMFVLDDLTKYHFKLREVVSAGEPLNPEVIDIWKKSIGLTIRDGYGQTESTLIAGNLPSSVVKLGSMGFPAFMYDVVITNDEGRELPPNEEGNIALKTNPKPLGLFVGYLADKDKEQPTPFRNDLYYTGDRAYKDNEGRIWFVGRSDDVIKASDYRIGPFEVENVLLKHPAVAEAAVIGIPHEIRGNLVKALIVLKPGYEPTENLSNEIFDFCKKNIASYKTPKAIEFTRELPKTISGKIRRMELRAREFERAKEEKTNDDEHLQFFCN